MVRNRLRPFAWLATAGGLVAATAAITACSGQVSNGTLSSTAQPVSVSAISNTATTSCGSGYAHPNVCCDVGPNQATSCVAYPGAPFTQCTSGSTTYPDPRNCCPLDGKGGCVTPPPTPVDAGSGSGGSCAYACPVGWYSPPESAGGSSSGTGTVDSTCCQTLPDGSGACSGGGGTLGSSSGAGSSGSSSGSGSSCVCACPACDPDSGVCAPCPPCNCPEEPVSTTCDACPAGWQTPEGEPLLCCATGTDGTISCFSQGVPPSPPQSEDAGAPTSCFGGGGGGPDGSTETQCGCSETVSGVDYTVTCTDPGGTCVCSATTSGTGSSTGTTVAEPSTSCNDVAALFSACGFPASTSGGSGSGSSGSSGSAGSSGSSSGG